MARSGHGRARERGVTLLELVVTLALMSILATAALPLWQVTVKREREVELRYALRGMRRAVDEFHKSYCASGGAAPGCLQVGNAPPGQPSQPQGSGPGQPSGGPTPPPAAPQATGTQAQLIDVSQFDPIDSKGYPPDLFSLVEGVAAQGGLNDEENRIRFLRRLPLDPMISYEGMDPSDRNGGWGVRSYQDEPDSIIWGRENVYDVYTKSRGKALDGSSYEDW